MTADLCQDIISIFLHLVLALMENFLEGIVPLRYIGALPQMSREQIQIFSFGVIYQNLHEVND